MPHLKVTFLGCGDAFGSGGRFQTCFLLHGDHGTDRNASRPSGEVSSPEEGEGVLIDCGASSLIAMRRFGVTPNSIGTVLLSHLHGDHFGGLPFFILDAQLVSKRRRPLRIAGPPGTAKRLEEAMEVFFPGSSRVKRSFEIEIIELAPGEPYALDGHPNLGEIQVIGHEVRHPSGAPPLALRVTCLGRTVAYTGDTEWCEGIVAAARGAHLLIAEAYRFVKPVKFHLDVATLREKIDALGVDRVVLTHMSDEVLTRMNDLEFECAEDGLTLTV